MNLNTVMKMKNNSIRIFILALLLALSSCNSPGNAAAGVKLFEKYNFDDEGYTVVGLVYHEQGDETQKRLGDFYINDIAQLNKIKNKWVTDAPSPFFACGYHYNIHVLKNGEELESFAINIENGCNTVVTDSGQYYFDPAHIQSLIGKTTQAKRERKTFTSLSEARHYYQSLPRNKKYLMSIPPKWEKFDGSFRFSVNCENDFRKGISPQECINLVAAKIKSNFPNELFSLEESGSSSGPEGNKILMKLQGSKNLYDNFEIYSIDWKWRDYTPSFLVFWKQ